MRQVQRIRQIAKIIAALVLIAFGVPGLSSRAENSSPKASTMLDCSGLPCVEVTFNGAKPLKMLVDTGNATSILDSSLAKAMGLEIKPLVGHDGKEIPGYSTTILHDLRIGDVPLGDLKVLVMDLAPDMTKGDMPKADGLLTYPVFDGRVLTMDYKAHRVQVSEKLTADMPCPHFCGAIANPTFGKEGPPIVTTTGFQLNGKPIVMQIDTMYSGSMMIYPTSVDKLGLQDQQTSTKTRLFPFTDGGVKMIEGTATVQAFGSTTLKRDGALYFATAAVHLPDGMFDGTVGHELFTGHVLTFDFRSHHFWMD